MCGADRTSNGGIGQIIATLCRILDLRAPGALGAIWAYRHGYRGTAVQTTLTHRMERVRCVWRGVQGVVAGWLLGRGVLTGSP